MTPTAPTFPLFPDFETIAYLKSDPGDHPSGGHCAGLPDTSLYAQWELVLAQHIEAFRHLVDQADSDADGWALTRPVLFAAHHVCEVALKTAWVAHRGSSPQHGHPLEPHWTRLAKAGGLKHLDPTQIEEAIEFIRFMASLTPDGVSTRYPLLGARDLGGKWCCLNSSALRDAVFAFVARVEPPLITTQPRRFVGDAG